MTLSIEDHKTYGDAVIERLTPPPPALKPFLKAFSEQHGKFVAAAVVVAKAREARDGALSKIATADDAQDATVDELADVLVGQRLGDRKNPFSTFTNYAPAELKSLAHKTEAKEIGALTKTIAKSGSGAVLKSALSACNKASGGVLSAIDATVKPQQAFAKALAARDALLPEWTLVLNRLKKNAAAYWADDAAAYRAAFAPPGELAAPKKLSKKTKAARAAKRAANKAKKSASA